MQVIELPEVQLSTCRLLDWRPAQQVKPNRDLLKTMKTTKKNQSEISRQRQQFITGTSNYHISGREVLLKQHYIAEWHARIKENNW